MAVKTSSKVEKLVKFISKCDDAIDWENSQCTAEEYEVERDMLKLSFIKDASPSVFVFSNPAAVVHRKSVMDASARGYQREEFMSIFHNVFTQLFLGLAPDLTSDYKPTSCTNELLQALDEQEIILEAGKWLIEKSSSKKA